MDDRSFTRFETHGVFHVEQSHDNGKTWETWGEPKSYTTAILFIGIARNQRRTVRLVNAAGITVA